MIKNLVLPSALRFFQKFHFPFIALVGMDLVTPGNLSNGFPVLSQLPEPLLPSGLGCDFRRTLGLKPIRFSRQSNV